MPTSRCCVARPKQPPNGILGIGERLAHNIGSGTPMPLIDAGLTSARPASPIFFFER
jgi:hypothetical protein